MQVYRVELPAENDIDRFLSRDDRRRQIRKLLSSLCEVVKEQLATIKQKLREGRYSTNSTVAASVSQNLRVHGSAKCPN
jgi:hypothetical protein